VTVSVREAADSVVISVADDGPGIPPERRDSIFGKGQKGLDSDGTGIGLYLVSTLVEQFGGEVWVEDAEPRGSVFNVRLLTAG
jgi:signal transduction histidine kinase